MAEQIDMLSTYCRRALLPAELQVRKDIEYKPEILEVLTAIENGTYQHQKMLFSGYNRGKTTSACACLLEFLKTRRHYVSNECPGLFLSVHQLCYQNRTIDKYNRDPELQALIRTACATDFLILDGVFSYVTQNDDLLLQAIYDKRQHCGKTTIVTTELKDPLKVASSILFRIARDAERKVSF